MNIASQEKTKHLAFEIGITLKGLHAVLEIVGGFLIYFISQAYIINTVLSITQEELSEDPKDILAQYLLNLGNSFSISSQHFIAFYLLSHGIIKLFLVVGLFRKRLWAYPVSIVVFTLFIAYQIHRWYYTHSVWLFIFTVLDAAIIWLTVHEYRYMKSHQLFAK